MLQNAAKQFGLDLSEQDEQRLIRLLDELDDWNQRMNLTAIRERSQQVTKHLLDSLSVNAYLRGPRILDVGTGAGFPGLPLAMANPQLTFTLLDSTGKKLKFIDHVLTVLGIENVTTVHARAESYEPAERFNTVISRAVGPTDRFAKWCGHLCAGGGRLLAMKGRYPTDELKALPNGWKLATVHRLSVPGLDEERHLVEICRSHDKVGERPSRSSVG
jgi:16S rRNA (guanine527-N7)-methyltransferase